MEVGIERAVLFAWVCISLCLLQHLQESEAVFSVGNSDDELAHLTDTSFSWLFDTWISSGESYDEPVIESYPFPPSQSPSPSPSPSSSPSPSPSLTPPPPSIPSPPSPSPPPPMPETVSILANLTISGAELVPAFNSYVFNYTASFGAKVRRFYVTAYIPKDYKLTSLYIENVQLNAGETSPPLKLGKRGKTVTYRIFVKEIGHDLSTYVLSISREAGHKGLGTVAIVFIVLACIVVVLVLLVVAYVAYVYARTGRIPHPRDLLSREGRSSLYTPLIAGESGAARTS